MSLIPAQKIPGLIPFECSYDGPGGRHSIVLYGSDAKSVLENNCDSLSGLAVDGIHEGTITMRGDDDA